MKIKVIIVDDSNVVRKLLRKILSSDDKIEVVSSASNGLLALPKIAQYKPDIVVLDIEMPELNGLETLKKIIAVDSNQKVIMFSTHTTDGARATIEALETGALDFLPKPNFSETGDPEGYIRQNLIPKIKMLSKYKKIHQKFIEQQKTTTEASQYITDIGKSTWEADRKRHKPNSIHICGIGISTGGPATLKRLFQHLPLSLNGTILISQHMPAQFTSQLAIALRQYTALGVTEAIDGDQLKRNHIYICPGDKHLELKLHGNTLHINLNNDDPYLFCKPSINYMFKSMAKVLGSHCLGVLMTGLGNDGYEGMIELKKSKAYLITQSQKSCVVFGMPRRSTKENLMNAILDEAGISEQISFFMGENSLS